jgi:hypothetical protein
MRCFFLEIFSQDNQSSASGAPPETPQSSGGAPFSGRQQMTIALIENDNVAPRSPADADASEYRRILAELVVLQKAKVRHAAEAELERRKLNALESQLIFRKNQLEARMAERRLGLEPR